jgi:hypothetical protein
MDLLVGRTFLGLIPDIWCVQLTTIGSASKQTTAMMYQVLQSPVTTVAYRGCKGHVTVADTETDVLELFSNRKPNSENRLVIMVLNTISSLLEHSTIFGDADVTLISVNKMYRLVVSKMCRYFQEITNEREIFPRETNSLPDFMGRTLQVGTFACPPFSFGTARNMSYLTKEDIDKGEFPVILMFKHNEVM